MKEFDFKQEKIRIPKHRIPKPKVTVFDASNQIKKAKSTKRNNNGNRYYVKRQRQIKRHAQTLL